MPIRDLSKTSDCYSLAEKMKKRHEKYLNSVVAVRIEKLLRILQVTMTGENLKGALNVVQVRQDFPQFLNKSFAQASTVKLMELSINVPGISLLG